MRSPETSPSGSGLLDRHYEQLECAYSIKHNPDYERLVTAGGNAHTAVHRWFHVKEAYSHALLARVAKDSELDRDASTLRIHDPFSGSGTTLASAGDLAREYADREIVASAVEVNPFLHLLSALKIHAYGTMPPDLLRTAQRVAARATRSQAVAAPRPALSTFSNPSYFPPESLNLLLKLRAAVAFEEKAGADVRLNKALQVCLAAAIEPASRLRKDGRALRFEPGKVLKNPVVTFLDRAHEMIEDWRPTDNFTGRVELADSRRATAPDQADLVLFSPPYPNNIDYSEVYKLENWLLGFVNDQNEFTQQRLRTLRSHPSIKLSGDLEYKRLPVSSAVDAVVDPICESIAQSRYSEDLRRTVRGYVDDMLRVLRRSAQALNGRKQLIFVVGNSQHGQRDDSIVIAADLIIAQLAQLVGFEIESIEVARSPARRRSRSPYLRESVVFARSAR